MKTICIAGLKGGIGKTTTATSLAYLLANEQDKKVLLVDADSQGNASMTFGVFDDVASGMVPVMAQGISESIMSPALEQVLDDTEYTKPKDLIKKSEYGVDVLTANGYLDLVNALLTIEKTNDQIFILKSFLESVAEEYDFCVIDCGLKMDITVINAVLAADLIISPISKLEPADQYSLYQRYPKGVTLADIQAFLDEMKKESEDALPEQSPQEQEDQLPGQMILSQDGECVDSDTEVADRQAEPIEPDLESEAAVLPEQKADTTKQTEQSGNHATMNLPESRPVEKENLKDAENTEESAESEIFAAGEAGKKRSLYDCKMKAIQKLIDEEMKSLKTLKNSPNIQAECAASSLAQEIILKHQIMLDAFILYKKRLEGSHEPK